MQYMRLPLQVIHSYVYQAVTLPSTARQVIIKPGYDVQIGACNVAKVGLLLLESKNSLPRVSLMPYLVTIALAKEVACLKSSMAPAVTPPASKASSVAALPATAKSKDACRCALLWCSQSSSGL